MDKVTGKTMSILNKLQNMVDIMVTYTPANIFNSTPTLI